MKVTVVFTESKIRKILERSGKPVTDEMVKEMTPKIQEAVEATYNENALSEAEYILNEWGY